MCRGDVWTGLWSRGGIWKVFDLNRKKCLRLLWKVFIEISAILEQQFLFDNRSCNSMWLFLWKWKKSSTALWFNICYWKRILKLNTSRPLHMIALQHHLLASLGGDALSERPNTSTTDDKIARVHLIVLDHHWFQVRGIAETKNVLKESVVFLLNHEAGDCTLSATFAYSRPCST